ncbi:MAG: Rieske (2Fe-2S) protein [Deltaproteobacteria bacterium]|nr:Rieske (2Fe-2S) protein [Deltaproteobacteria bacterium]
MESSTWCYLARENEFPNVGDFKLLRLAKRSVIVVRGEDGQLRVLLNVCRHRSVPVCRHAHGNARTFTCTFHGWVYDTKGALIGVQGPGRTVREFSERAGLRPVPRVETSGGRLYASLEADGESLAAYLGKEPGNARTED